MHSTYSLARLVALIAAFPLVLFLQSATPAQDPALEVFYSKLEPKEQFKYKWKGAEAVCTAGVFRWEVPASEFGTNGLDRNFSGYCAEVLVPIVVEKTYRFRMNSLFDPTNYASVGKDGKEIPANAPLMAQRRATAIKELFGRYYRNPVEKPFTADEVIGMQVALWEVIQETEPAEGMAKFDLFAGDFQANYPKAEAPAYVLKGQEYLDSLTGNDNLFYENPDLKGRELIRLQGIENAEKVVAQSQFALRFVGGGGAGNTARPLTASSGGVAGFSPGGALPAAGGGGGGLLAGTGGGSGGSSSGGSTSPLTTTPTSTTTTTPTSSVTTTTPPTSSITTPPTGGPDTPTDKPPGTPTQFNTNPVPAPPAILLAVAAFGTIGSWRFGVRLLRAK